MMFMNNILRRTVSSVLAFTVALSSVQLYGTTASAVATGVKGDANSDGVVTDADLAVYESYLFNGYDISDEVIEDMDISYTGEAGFYAYVSLNDYLAVKKYLAGETASVEDYNAYTYVNSYSSERVFFSGYKHSIDVSLTVDGESCTEHEIIWNEQPDSVLSLSEEGKLTTNAVASDIGKTYKAIAIGKIDGSYTGAYVVDITFRKAAFDISTDDGEFTYGNEILITQPGTYNITSTDPASQVEATETICISENVDSGKVILNLNGMNINYGDAYYPGDFIYVMAELCDVDIVLSGSNVIRNAGVSLFTQGQVNIYGSDADTLSLLGNSFLGADYLTINGGDITIKSNSYCALGAYQLTMMGGSLDASFAPVEGAIDNTSHTSLKGIGMECEFVTIRSGNLRLSGNEGGVDPQYIQGVYVSPLFCDIDISVSDDGTTYSPIDGSPFSDPDNSPSAYESTQAVGAVPDNAIDITNLIIGKTGIKIATTNSYQYQVTINSDEHSSIQYGEETTDTKTFFVEGGKSLTENIDFLPDEGWEIDKITASINGGAPVEVTDISAITINGDTVINVITKDTEAPVINGITDGSYYCGTITFTVTDDSDVTVTIDGETVLPDSNGVYTIVGDWSGYLIVATDEFDNETIHDIVVFDRHPSTSGHQNNEDGTHTSICDYCYENVVDEHDFSDWRYTNAQHYKRCVYCLYEEYYEDHDILCTDNEDGTHAVSCDICGYEAYEPHDMAGWVNETDTVHRNDCLYCDYYETAEHVMSDGTDNGDGTHKLECLYGCGYITDEGHNYSEWENNYDTGMHERACADCNHTEEAVHIFGECTDSPETGYCKRECEDCGHIEEVDHNFSVWTENSETGEHERICSKCKRTESEAHIMGDWMFSGEEEHFRECNICNYREETEHNFSEWTDNHGSGKCERKCVNCGHIEEAEHIFGDWTDNHETGKCERVCVNCSHTEEAEHSYGEWTDNYDTGKHERECETCGHVEEADHIFGEWTDNHDTGKHEKICENCGHTEEANHTFGEWIKNQETGKFEKECADCGHTEVADHAYGDWTDNLETGKHERTCAICGETEEADHEMSEWTADGGEHTRECTACGRQEAENHSAEYKEHSEYFHERLCTVCGGVSYGEHVKDAKYEGNEKHCILCIVCGYSEKVESCKGVWQTVKESTCTEEGIEEMICDVCGEEHTRVIEMLPHEFVNGRCSSCYLVDPTIGDSSTNPPTGVTLGTGLAALIPASALVFFARPKTKKRSK